MASRVSVKAEGQGQPANVVVPRARRQSDEALHGAEVRPLLPGGQKRMSERIPSPRPSPVERACSAGSNAKGVDRMSASRCQGRGRQSPPGQLHQGGHREGPAPRPIFSRCISGARMGKFAWSSGPLTPLNFFVSRQCPMPARLVASPFPHPLFEFPTLSPLQTRRFLSSRAIIVIFPVPLGNAFRRPKGRAMGSSPCRGGPHRMLGVTTSPCTLWLAPLKPSGSFHCSPPFPHSRGWGVPRRPWGGRVHSG